MKSIFKVMVLVGFLFGSLGCSTLTPSSKALWETKTLPALKTTAESALKTVEALTLEHGTALVVDLTDFLPNMITKFSEWVGLSEKPEKTAAPATP